MRYIAYATESAPGCRNEDYVVAGPSWVVLLDGATAPSGVESGCSHGVSWLVERLAAALVAGIAGSERALDDVVAEAISEVCDAHGTTCDLTNPDSPSSTVAIVREREGHLDYLALADSPIILDTARGIQPVIDDRTAHLPSYTPEGVRSCRNQPDGFWVASTNPEAGFHAMRGSVAVHDVRRIALLTDGAARYVERFHLGDWRQLIDMLDEHGPGELIRRVRQAEEIETESERSGKRGKLQDDATAALVRY
jgi:Protein phosphatase 2C